MFSLKRGIRAIILGGLLMAAPASLAQTQLAYMNSVDWLRQIELLRPKQKDPSERPWVSSEVRNVDLTTTNSPFPILRCRASTCPR